MDSQNLNVFFFKSKEKFSFVDLQMVIKPTWNLQSWIVFVIFSYAISFAFVFVSYPFIITFNLLSQFCSLLCFNVLHSFGDVHVVVEPIKKANIMCSCFQWREMYKAKTRALDEVETTHGYVWQIELSPKTKLSPPLVENGHFAICLCN
jgi:hypothetical protein